MSAFESSRSTSPISVQPLKAHLKPTTAPWAPWKRAFCPQRANSESSAPLPETISPSSNPLTRSLAGSTSPKTRKRNDVASPVTTRLLGHPIQVERPFSRDELAGVTHLAEK